MKGAGRRSVPCDTKKKKEDELPAVCSVPRWCGSPLPVSTGRIRVAMVRALRRAQKRLRRLPRLERLLYPHFREFEILLLRNET